MLDIVDMEAIQVLLLMLLLIFCLLLLLLLYKCNKVVSLLRCAAATKKKVIAVAGTAGCCCCSWNLLLLLLLPMWLSCAAQLCQAAPPNAAPAAAGETAWPPMQHYDIWSADLVSAPLGDEQLEMDGDLFAGEQKEVEQELEQELEEEELPVQEQLLLQQQAYSYNPEWNTSNLGSSSRRPKGELRKFKVDHIYFPFLPLALQ